MKTANLNGISIAYDRRGSGTPLVLIHGYPLDHTIWDQVAPLLEDSFDVIMPDVRGFGASSAVYEPYTVDDLATDIWALLDSLGLDKAAVVGHSMGGYIALAFARLYPTHIRGLGLVSSQAVADSDERRQGRYDTANQVSEKGVRVVAESMTPKLTTNTELQPAIKVLIEKQPAAGVIGALKAMAEREDAQSLLALLQYAVVIVHGDADELIPVARGREMKELIPQANYVEVPGTGHLPMMEDAEKTAEALRHLK
jgi:pimeloyl-ACP methyl ester carboxylesterase